MTVGTAGTVYIPLRFWFNRNAGLALPLIALQYHEVKILVDVNTLGHTDIGVIKSGASQFQICVY